MLLDYLALLWRFLKKLRESIIALFLSALASVFAGLFLGTAQHLLVLVPGLILLVPAAIGMRGNIFAALGSRLGSALHLGTIKSFSLRNEVVRSNVYSTITLTLVTSVFLGFLAKGFAHAFGLESISVFSFVAISFIAGFVSGLILLLLTFAVSFASYKKGWDPDNITSPLITALGDFFTIPSLLLAANIVMSLSPAVINIIAIATTVAMSMNIILLLVQKINNTSARYRKIAMQSLVVLMLAGGLDGFAGAFVEMNLEKLITLPVLLVMLPAFLETGGNVGNVLAARLSTKLHLGSIESRLGGTELRNEILGSAMLAYIIFPLLGLVTYIMSAMFFQPRLGILDIIVLTTVAGFILHLLIIFLTVLIAMLSFRYGFDPDNTTIPLLTSATDIIGVLALLFTIGLLGIA